MAYQFSTRYEPLYCPLITLEVPKINHLPPSLNKGRHVDRANVSKKGYVKSKHKRLPDFFKSEASIAVCEQFKDLVESLEPGVHQFFPIDFFDKKDNPMPGNGPYYLLNIGQKFDAVIAEKSNVKWLDVDPKCYPGLKSLHRAKGPWQLVMSQPEINGRHLWLPDKMLFSEYYCSDKLVSAIEKMKLKGFDFRHIEEVDEEWRPEGNVAPT